MRAARSSFGDGRYVAGEQDVTLMTTHVPTAGRTPLIWCHGNYGTAAADFAAYDTQLRLLAQRHTVIAADLGFNTFGNPIGTTRVGQAIAYLAASWGSSGPAVLVGASMGAAVALNYARVHPENVAAVACIIPALDLNVANDHPAADEIDLAYPPAYDDAVHGPTYSPVQFARSLPGGMPIHLWTSSNDPTVAPATADMFVARRPQTGRTDIGAQGHGGISLAVPKVADWLTTLA